MLIPVHESIEHPVCLLQLSIGEELVGYLQEVWDEERELFIGLHRFIVP